MRQLCLGIAALALVACGGTETGNPSATLQLAIQDTTSDASVASSSGTGSALSVQRAWVSFSLLRFVACDASQASLEAPGLLVDLQSAPPELALFDTSVTAYCGLHVELAPAAALAAGAPAELANNALLLQGVRSDGASFVLQSATPSSLDLLLPAGQSFDASFAVLAFDLAAWFTGVDVHGAAPDATGVVHIDAASNTAVQAAFDARRAPALSLYLDLNHDGRLESGESTPLVTAH